MKAKYTSCPIAAYKGNPLIEALPPLPKDRKAVSKLLRQTIPYSEEERNLPGEYREHSLISVLQFFEPLPHHIELEAKISRALRFGYTGRNPMEKGFWRRIPDNAEALAERMQVDTDRRRSINTGFSLVGVSGTGKSTTVERILQTYPQVIYHNSYTGKPFDMTQISWLKLDCPFDGSVKGLCFKFFSALDELLGTNYFEKSQRAKKTIDQLMPYMARLGSIHGLGLLVIDEIQHLSTVKWQTTNQTRMLNFFVELINTVGLPILLVGTPKAISVLTTEFRSTRRSAGQGDVIWDRMKNDATWSFFLEALWPYQYTKKACPLTKELSHTLYDETQGITDFAVKLYLLAQCRAIRTGKEEITSAILKSVAKDSLQLAEPFLKALRTQDFSALPSFEDIRPLNFQEAIQAA